MPRETRQNNNDVSVSELQAQIWQMPPLKLLHSNRRQQRRPLELSLLLLQQIIKVTHDLMRPKFPTR